MKTFAITLAAGLLATTAVFAQSAADRSADALNARELERMRSATTGTATPAPTPARVAAPVAVGSGRVYVGGSLGWGGAHLDERAQWSGTGSVGYEFNRFLAVEGSVDYDFRNQYRTGSRHALVTQEAGQKAFVNLIAGMPVGNFQPYVLAGAGAGFNGSGDHHQNTEALWNVGGGVAYNVTRNWQLDARYRHIDAWQGNRHAEQAFSLGVNYRF